MTTPKRNPRSAKDAGTRFERSIADFLAEEWDDRIDRRVKTGAADKGDIGGFRAPSGEKIMVECKNTTRMALPQWWREAITQAGNDDALHAIVIHKRHGTTDPGQQWVTLNLDQFLELLHDWKDTQQ